MAENNAMDYAVQGSDLSEYNSYSRSASVGSTQGTRRLIHSAEETRLNEFINSAVKQAFETYMSKFEKLIDGTVKSASEINDKFGDIDRQLQTLTSSSIKIKASKKEYKQQIEVLTREKNAYEKQLKSVQNELSSCKAEVQSEQSDQHEQPSDLLSWLTSWVKTNKNDHSNIKYLQQQNSGLKARIKELETTVAQKDSTIDRLRGKKMDFLEKSEAVIDISKNENHYILDSFKKFLDIKLPSLATQFKTVSKDYSLLNGEELQKMFQYCATNPEQSYIQVELSATLQKCYDVAKDDITIFTIRRFEHCIQRLKQKLTRNEDDDEYIYQVEEYVRRQHRTNNASTSMVTTGFKTLITVMFNPMILDSKPLIVPTRQFFSRSVEQLPQQDISKYQEKIKNEFIMLIENSKLQPVWHRCQAKTKETALEAAKIIWKLVTASPPIILCSEIKIPYNNDLHVLCPTGYVSYAKRKQISEEDDSSMPHVIAYAIPIVFRNNNGHVAFKGQVFV